MRKLTKKHHNSKNCFICGLENEKGLHAEFYETDQGELACLFKPHFFHQSYPGIVHGGISASVLDELMGRALNVTEPDQFSMTVKLELKYKKPVPYEKKLVAIAKVTKNTRLLYEAEGVLYDDENNICVVAKGKYMKMSIDKISDNFGEEGEWFINDKDDDPVEINI